MLPGLNSAYAFSKIQIKDGLFLRRLFFGNISGLSIYYNNSVIIIGTLIGLGIAIGKISFTPLSQ
jgi:hypothetical protein